MVQNFYKKLDLDPAQSLVGKKYPVPSMYDTFIYIYIYHKKQPNVYK